jgi:histidinol-phosphate aminotransferase
MNADPLSWVREDIRALRAYPVASSEGLVKLDAMENPYALPPELAQQLGQRLGGVALNRYPPGDLAAFRRRLGARAGLPEGCDLLLGNGSDELIHLVILACARPGAVVLSPWPSFSMYRMSAQLDGCRFIDVALRPDFGLDRVAMLEAIARERPAIVFLSYPNNPTGNLFDRADMEAVLEAAPGLVVIDEAYLPFAQQTWIDRVPSRPGLLVLRTLSKLGLAGLRLGYLCGAPELIAQFDKVRPPYNVNVLTLAAVDFLLDHFSVLDDQAGLLRSARAQLLAQLRSIPGLQAFDSAANFVLLRVADATGIYAKLLRQGILVKDVSGMHPLLRDCLRVTVGSAQENARFVAALRGILAP